MIFDCGFVVPLESEAKNLIKKLIKPEYRFEGGRRIILGGLMNQKVSIIISGCGKIKSASATQLLIDKYPAKFYINYGSAGAISSKLNIGDVVIANEVVEHDVKELFPEKIPAPIHILNIKPFVSKKIINNEHIHIGRVLSGDEDIISVKRGKELAEKYKGLCVDLESAGFALTCNLNKTECIVVRGISDNAHEYTNHEYEMNKEKVMENILPIIQIILNKKTS